MSEIENEIAGEWNKEGQTEVRGNIRRKKIKREKEKYRRGAG